MGAHTVYKGYISFGLVSVPIKLYAAARDESIHFTSLHTACNSRLKEPKYCPTCDRLVDRDEIAKAYEVGKDEYIIVDEDEIKNLKPASTSTIEIQHFVDLMSIDPIYFDASYFVCPDTPGLKVYELLYLAMVKAKKAAVGQICMRNKESRVIIRPFKNGLMIHTSFTNTEVREIQEFTSRVRPEVDKKEIELGVKLMEQMTSDFNPSAFVDEYQGMLAKLIESKQTTKQQPQSEPSTKKKSKAKPKDVSLLRSLEASLK